MIFRFISAGGASFSWYFIFLLLRSRDRDRDGPPILLTFKDRSKAVLVVPMGCTEEESTRHWVVSLTNMTLNKVILPAGESVYQDAKGQPMPP